VKLRVEFETTGTVSTTYLLSIVCCPVSWVYFFVCPSGESWICTTLKSALACPSTSAHGGEPLLEVYELLLELEGLLGLGVGGHGAGGAEHGHGTHGGWGDRAETAETAETAEMAGEADTHYVLYVVGCAAPSNEGDLPQTVNSPSEIAFAMPRAVQSVKRALVSSTSAGPDEQPALGSSNLRVRWSNLRVRCLSSTDCLSSSLMSCWTMGRCWSLSCWTMGRRWSLSCWTMGRRWSLSCWTMGRRWSWKDCLSLSCGLASADMAQAGPGKEAVETADRAETAGTADRAGTEGRANIDYVLRVAGCAAPSNVADLHWTLNAPLEVVLARFATGDSIELLVSSTSCCLNSSARVRCLSSMDCLSSSWSSALAGMARRVRDRDMDTEDKGDTEDRADTVEKEDTAEKADREALRTNRNNSPHGTRNNGRGRGRNHSDDHDTYSSWPPTKSLLQGRPAGTRGRSTKRRKAFRVR
jgi:hypothetical protein